MDSLKKTNAKSATGTPEAPRTASTSGTNSVAPSPLAFADFRFFWVARFAAVIATMAMVVIIGYQVYDVARTDYGMSIRQASFQLGLVGLFQFVPLAVLTPVAGWISDRYDRRSVARFAMSIDLIIALALGWLTWSDQLNLPMLFAFAAFHGIARAFVGPSMNAIAPNIVPSRTIPKAIAMNSIAWQSGSILGPAFGGLLYGYHSSMPYAVAATLLAVAIGAISAIRPVLPPPTDVRRHPMREMIDGLRFTWNERFLLAAITLDLFAVLLAGAKALLPVYARDILHVGVDGLGQMYAAPAVGAVIVAIFLALRPLETNVGTKMLWAVVFFGLATIAFGFSTNFLLSLALLVLIGAADMLSVFVRQSLIQLNTPDAMRGRVGAVSGLAISASNELGEMQSGVAAALLGPVGAVVFGGAGAIAVTVLWSRLFPELRRARTFEPQFRRITS